MTGTGKQGRLVLRRAAPEAWDDVVAGHPDATPFHLAAFLSTAGRHLGLRTDLTVLEADGRVIGAVPLLIRARGPLALVNHRLPFPYLGPLLPPGWSPDAVLSAIRRHLRPQVLLSYGVESVGPLMPTPAPGWEYRDDFESAVIVLKGRDDDALLGRFDALQRANVRRGIRRGFETGPATRQDVAEHLASWSAAAFARQGLPPRWPAGAQVAIYDQMAASGRVLATAARRDGELLGVTVDFSWADRVYAWEIGLNPTGRAAGVAPVLSYAAVCRARDLGAAEMDILGAPNEGIARYKRSLGAEFRPRGVARWASPLLPWGKRVRHGLDAVRARVRP